MCHEYIRKKQMVLRNWGNFFCKKLSMVNCQLMMSQQLTKKIIETDCPRYPSDRQGWASHPGNYENDLPREPREIF